MKIATSAIATAILALAIPAFAQEGREAQPPQQPPSQQQSDATKVSVTGCLAKGSTVNTYQITDQKTGEAFPFNGPEKLDQYVNQTVTLTGTMQTQGSQKAFRPERISPVATTCQK